MRQFESLVPGRVKLMFVCCCFTSCMRSYQDGHWLMTMYSIWWLYIAARTEWGEATSTMTWYSIQSYYTDNQFLFYPTNAEHLARKWQVLMSKTLVWLDHGSNPQGSNHGLLFWEIPRFPKTGDERSTYLSILSGHQTNDLQMYRCHFFISNVANLWRPLWRSG